MRTFLPAAGLFFCVSAGLGACLPNGPPTGASENKPAATAKPAATVKRTAPRGSGRPAAPDPPLTEVFTDGFERGTIGEDWRSLGGAWKVQDGKLCGQQAHNRGIWLARRLPVNARIEWEGSSASPDGDIKAELWGDGLSGATSASYTNATSYLLVLGGWKNTLHVLARLDEHGANRLELRTDRTEDDPRARPVSPGQVYHFRAERLDGRTVSWFVDDVPMLRLADPDPLTGQDHDHFGFNDWDTPVCFDNVKISPLPG